MSEEKTLRNIKVYLDKRGFTDPSDKKPTQIPLSYRELIQKYDLSYSMLRTINLRVENKLNYYIKWWKKNKNPAKQK